MRATSYLATLGVGLILTVVPLSAHHAFSSEFDADKPVNLEGAVSKLEWINPHAWIHIDVTGPDGKVETASDWTTLTSRSWPIMSFDSIDA